MNEPIKAKAHGEIDYGFAAVNVVVPSLIGSTVISLRTYGWIEAATIPMVGLLSAKVGALSSPKAKAYFGAVGLALGAVYTLTDWNAPADS